MKSKAKNNVVYILLLFLLGSACLWTGSPPDVSPTSLPTSGRTSAAEATVTSAPAVSKPTASPTPAAGSFADFQVFAAQIAAALQAGETSFFEDYAAPSTWYCLDDEVLGVCKDLPADTTLEGIPVTYDWRIYEVHSVESYKEMWQTIFTDHANVKLVATANRFGDNPLMPMASQSFFVIVSVENTEYSTQGVRVLFFEYTEAWQLVGELVTVENTASWLDGTCSTCYDAWTAWQD